MTYFPSDDVFFDRALDRIWSSLIVLKQRKVHGQLEEKKKAEAKEKEDVESWPHGFFDHSRDF